VAVSPADFELYSRATGTPLPRTPQEQMRLAPQVHSFIQNREYQRGPVQRTAGALDNVIGGIRNTALIGAGLLGAGLAASAYANKRDSEPKTPDSDANRYDKAGNVDLSATDRRIAAENAEKLANRPPRQKKEKPQPYVRIPVRTKENYGSPSRDLASEADNLAMAITKGDSPVQNSDIVLDGPDEGTTSVYVRDDQLAKTQGKTRLGQWGANVTDRLSKSQGSPMWNWGAPGMSTGIVLSPRPWENTGASWTSPDLGAAGDLLSATGEAAGNVILSHVPGGEIVQNLGGFTGGVLKNIPGFTSGAASLGTRALELGTVGALTGADRLAHEVARAGIKTRDVYENYLGGTVPTIGELQEGAKTAIGITGRLAGDAYRLGQKTRVLHDEKLVPAVRKGIGGTAQLSLNLLTGGNPQTDEPGPDQTRTAPSVGITDETIQDPWENEGIGVGAHVESGPAEPIRDRVDKLLATASEYLGATDHFQGGVGPKNATGATWVRSGDGKLRKQEDPGSSFLRGVRVSPEGEITVSEEATLSNWKNRKEAASAAGVDKVVDEYHYPQYAHDDYDDPLVQQAKAHLLEEKMNQLGALDQGKPWGDFEGKTKTTPQSKSGGQWYNQELKGPFGGDKPGRYERSGMTDATYVQSRIPDSEVLSGESDNRADTATRMSDAYDRLNEKEDTPSRQMSYTYPLQGNMTNDEYFNQGAFKIAKTAVDNPDFDSEAYYDNKKKWIQDQMD